MQSQVDIDNMELVDMDQLDMDDQGEIRPSARGLGSDLKQQWYSAIDEEVRIKLKEREESMKAAVQVRSPSVLGDACVQTHYVCSVEAAWVCSIMGDPHGRTLTP